MTITNRARLVAAMASVMAGAAITAFFAASPARAWDLTSAATGPVTTYDNSSGDVWSTTWADDGNLYTVSDDTTGFNNACNSNFAVSLLTGSDPAALTGSTINCMNDYGAESQEGPDGATWKATSIISVNGVLYLGIARQTYGGVQPSANASIIESTDHGATWTRSAATNYSDPMWPGTSFPTPFFIQYGQDDAGGVDGGDTYVYAISNDGSWNNGNTQILGRVPRDEIASLNSADWQYYDGAGADGRLDGNWTSNPAAATPINQATGRLSMTGVTYDAPLHTYIMPEWYYPNTDDTSTTILQIYTAPAPWGPWNVLETQDTSPNGYYNPSIVAKFTSSDGRNLTAFLAGNYNDAADYKLNVLPLALGTEGTLVDDTTTGTGTDQIDYSGGTWTPETDAPSVGAFDNTDHYSDNVGDYALIRFSGTAARLYMVKDPGTGVAGVSICDGNGLNCGAETDVQTYSPVREGAQAVYQTGILPQGDYALRVRVTGQVGAAGSDYLGIDAAEITGERINDSTTGTTSGTIDYSHGTWTYETDAATVGAYENDDHYSDNPGDYALVHFTGIQASVTVVKDPGTGYAGFAVCDANGNNCGAETLVDTYNPTRIGDQAVYTTPVLARGDYTLRVRVTGQPGAEGSAYVGLDYIDVQS